jgi:hypothetical protein
LGGGGFLKERATVPSEREIHAEKNNHLFEVNGPGDT